MLFLLTKILPLDLRISFVAMLCWSFEGGLECSKGKAVNIKNYNVFSSDKRITNISVCLQKCRRCENYRKMIVKNHISLSTDFNQLQR